MTGLAVAFGSSATATLHVEGSELDVRVDGEDLGLLIGPGGRTLMAVQDLARVASQRKLGDHETRPRVERPGYRGGRRARGAAGGAAEKFPRPRPQGGGRGRPPKGAGADGVRRPQDRP